MKTDELAELIKSRRSIRTWQAKAVPESLILQAIELATYAPNAGNQQNWHFYVVTNPKTIAAIADGVQKSADDMAAWPEAAQFGEAARNMFKKSSFFRGAPALIAVAASQYSSPAEQIMALREKVDPKAKAMREWRAIANSKIQSVSSAIAYLLLALHQMGLGAVWMTGPIQAKGAIENIIKVPAGSDIVALIPVGYPAETPPLKERKAVNLVCEIIR
jgi:nitroreductase